MKKPVYESKPPPNRLQRRAEKSKKFGKRQTTPTLWPGKTKGFSRATVTPRA